MDLINQFVDNVLKINPDKINGLGESLGPWLYVLLFAIIFAETGLVIIPFLPGDSLLFALGAVAALPNSPINIVLTAALLITAAILGDAVNYSIGNFLGPAVLKREDSRFLNKKHLHHAHEFYETYGGKTIIFARFIPIIRTFAPFVAGIGSMTYSKFALYNVVGGAFWVILCLGSGYFFGGFEIVKKNFELVLIAVIVISLLPPAIEFLRGWMKSRSLSAAAIETAAPGMEGDQTATG